MGSPDLRPQQTTQVVQARQGCRIPVSKKFYATLQNLPGRSDKRQGVEASSAVYATQESHHVVPESYSYLVD